MANQWGRDSSFQSGGKSGRGWLTVIVMILCLGLGAAGGYAAFRFVQPDNSAAVEDASRQAAQLNDALAAARQEVSQARADQAATAAQVEDLTAQLARQAADLDTMVEKLAASSSPDQAPETDTAALQILTRDLDALAKDNQTLKADLAALEAERDAQIKRANATEERLAAEIARLQNEVLPQLTVERDRLKQQNALMVSDQESLNSSAKAAAETHASDAKRIAELEARLADTERELTASQDVLDALRLEKRTVEVPKDAADSQEVAPAQKPDAGGISALESRNPDDVARALRSAPGLGTLTEADRQQLADALVAGECVTTALKSVFERVPILTLRNLIRDLNSDC